MGKQAMVRMIYIAIIAIGLIGVSFAGWTDFNKLVASITTGFINYDFQEAENSLVLVRGSSSGDFFRESSSVAINASITVDKSKNLSIYIYDAEPIMNMTEGDFLRIKYKLREETGTVRLKPKEEELGELAISLKPESVRWEYNGSLLSASDYASLVPTNLGVYRAYHSFDGLEGVIDLIPIVLSSKPADYLTFDFSADETQHEDGRDMTASGKEESVTTSDVERVSPGTDVSKPEEGDGSFEAAGESGNALPAETPDDDILDFSMDNPDSLTEKADMSISAASDAYNYMDAENEIHDDDRSREDERKLRISSETAKFSAEYSFIIPLRLDQYNAR